MQGLELSAIGGTRETSSPMGADTGHLYCCLGGTGGVLLLLLTARLSRTDRIITHWVLCYVTCSYLTTT